MNGVWEAIYHGVPMVALPLYRDQHNNAQRVVSRGMGLKLDITTFTSDDLVEALRNVNDDPRYVLRGGPAMNREGKLVSAARIRNASADLKEIQSRI